MEVDDFNNDEAGADELEYANLESEGLTALTRQIQVGKYFLNKRIRNENVLLFIVFSID